MLRYRLLADLIVLLHFGYVLFVIGGWLVTVVGGICGWRWVRNIWFRILHLMAIGLVVFLTWSQIACPLTTLENTLRRRAGQSSYPADCIGYWVHKLLFYEAPGWVFTATYTAFGICVLVTLWLVPPRLPRSRGQPQES